jgi:serine/threonine protein kinase/WD40 repeat protein
VISIQTENGIGPKGGTVTPERYQHLCELFDQAQQRPTAEWPAFLEEACGGDADLRAELEKLLLHDASRESQPLLQGPCPVNLKALVPRDANGQFPTLPAASPPDEALLGRRVGPYEIKQWLGSGGMGSVYRAIRTEPYRQEVALKVIRRGQDTDEVLRRFHTERQVLADLQHPHIARLLDGGTTDDGRPYLVMEYIDGQPLNTYCNHKQLPTRGRLELFLAVCAAIHHAHQHDVLHRDLKPGNVLVTAEGVVKITDFGLAKRLHADTMPEQTQSGAILGTPGYMAPEQAAGKGMPIGPAVDLYALGAILYELLTGRPPFRGETIMDTLWQVRHAEPVPPSRLHARLARDLDTICLTCLRKEPQRRYASVAVLADDVQCYLRGAPIRARRTHLPEQVWRWCRRNPGVASLTAAVAILLLVTVTIFCIATLVQGERNIAQANLERAQVAEAALQQEIQRTRVEANIAFARASRWSGRMGQRFAALDRLGEAARLAALLHLPPEKILELRNEVIACLPRVDLRPDRRWEGFPPGIDQTGVAFDRSGELYARVDSERHITVHRLADNQPVVSLTDVDWANWKFPEARLVLRFSPDRQFLVAKGNRNFQLPTQVWRLRDPTSHWKIPAGSDWWCLDFDFSPDSRLLAAVQPNGDIGLYDVGSGKEQKRFPRGPEQNCHCLRFHPNGTQLAVGRGLEVQLLDLTTGQVVQRFPHAGAVIDALAWSADGLVLASGCTDHQVCVWDVASGRKRAACQGHTDAVIHVALTARGDVLASTSWDGTTRLWDTWTGKQLLSTSGFSMDFSNDDRWLGRGYAGASVGRWEAAVLREYRPLYGHPSEKSVCVDISRDGRWLASAGQDGVRLWDLAAGKTVAVLPVGPSTSAIFHPSEPLLITAGKGGLYRWPLHVGKGPAGERVRIGPAQTLTLPTVVSEGHLSWSRDGRTLMVAHAGGVLLLDSAGKPRPPGLLIHPGLWFAALSPDGRWVASATWHGQESFLWDVRGEHPRQALPGRRAQFAFDPAGKWLIIGTASAYAVHEVGSWRLHRQLPRASSEEGRAPVAFSEDGRLLAVAYSSQEIKLLDAATWQGLASLPAPEPHNLNSLALSGDGRWLAAGTQEGVIQLWDMGRIRSQLAALGLDWSAPAPIQENRPVAPIQVDVVLGDCKPIPP